jgi:flagellar assembly protein FliH
LSTSNEIVLRGHDAARAQRIDLVAPQVFGSLNPTGPWAAHVNDSFSEAREEGFAIGQREGLEAGMERGLAEARHQTDRLATAVQALQTQTENRVNELAERLASDAANLALAIAEAILGREIASAADPGAEAIARCLELAPSAGAVTAHLHPDDIKLLGPVPGFENRDLTMVADSKVQRGDAVVMVDETVIDGRLNRALERVAQVLL